MKAFIKKEEVLEKLKKDDVRIVDCRFQLGSPEKGKSLYIENHILGAVYFHLEEDLSGSIKDHGGRHPLPEIEEFKRVLEESGIENDTTVIAYDEGGEAFASRLWWLLKYVGHQEVYILDGGYKGWIEASYPVESTIPTFLPTNYYPNVQTDMLATYEEVKKTVEAKDSILIDSRDEKRYLGIEEPVDKKAGHIPTALNYVWTEGFEQGRFKASHNQKKRFEKLDKEREIIVYCGSGITATPNYIALKEAGYKKVKLYAGSFSDWISYDENEVATEE